MAIPHYNFIYNNELLLIAILYVSIKVQRDVKNMEKIKKQDIHLIFQQIRNGDNSKLNDLYSKYNKLIYGIAFSILKNKEDSEDIVQIVFAKIFEMDKEKLPTNNETSWLYSLTKNETLNYLRKQKENVSLDDIYYIAEEDKELNKIIEKDKYNRIISKLNEQEREIVSLKILSNMSFKEIALLLKMPIGTVQWKYYTALHTLKLLLGNISMFILGILIFIKGNTANIKIEQTNSSNDINIDNENESEEKDQTENQASSSVESDIDSSISTDNTIIQNEIIEIPETEEAIHTNINIGILSFTGIFLLFSIIFTIIFIKHQQNAHKNVSK